MIIVVMETDGVYAMAEIYVPPRHFFYQKVYINMTVTSKGRQFDRLATMWLGDIEIFRTSTAEPKPDPGVTWTFMKDMTTYLELWMRNQTVIFDLGNAVDEKNTGSFHVLVTAHFFDDGTDFFHSGPHPEAPHYIMPISAERSEELQPSYFSYPHEDARALVLMPRNIHRAILTVAATGQGEEEFWWSNVPQSAANYFQSDGGNSLPGMGSFREIQVFIDDQVVGLAWPFPVVFTGGIAPPLHRPLVGLQAFDLREYEIDITPWLSILCDGAYHNITMQVVAADDTVRPYSGLVPAPKTWILSGKLFLWFNQVPGFTKATAPQDFSVGTIDYKTNITGFGPDGFRYHQTISRSFNVSSLIHTTSGGKEPVEWTQSFAMHSSGIIKDHGNAQNVTAIYMGQGSSRYGLDPAGLWTAFKYPIEASYRYLRGKTTFTTYAELKQGQELVIMGHTPFHTGIEPFLERLGNKPMAGTNVRTERQGKAHFIQHGDEFSTGHSQTQELYRLWAVPDLNYGKPFPHLDFKNPATTLDVVPGPLLYERFVKLYNESRLEDNEKAWLKRVEPRGTALHTSDRPEFATLPLYELGGTNAFQRGLDGRN